MSSRKYANRLDRDTIIRSLLTGGLIFAVLFALDAFVIPECSVLDRQPFDALLTGAVALAACWIAFRVRRR